MSVLNLILQRRVNLISKISLIIIFILSLFTCLSYGDALKIGVFDLQKIMEESEKGKLFRREFETELKKKREELESQDKEVKALEKEIFEKLSEWGSETGEKKQEEVNQKLKDYQRKKEEFEEHMSKKNQQLNQNMIDEITKVLNRIGKKENYTIILEKRNLLFFSPSLEITDKIIKKYDEEKK